MFKFLMGVAFGAAGYWAWQSFGRDLLGLSNDQDTYSNYSSNTTFGSPSGTSSFGSSGVTGGGAASSSSSPSTGSTAGSTESSPTTTP